MRRKINTRRAFKVLKPQHPELVIGFAGGDLRDSFPDPFRLVPSSPTLYTRDYGPGFTATCAVVGRQWILHLENTGGNDFVLEFTAPYHAGLYPPCFSDENPVHTWTEAINTTGDDMQFFAYVLNNSTLALGS